MNPMVRLQLDFPTAARERGAALVFAMLVLVVLTILGVSAMRTTALEQLMAGNTQEMTRAFAAAESEMSWALANMPDNPMLYVDRGDYAYGDLRARAQTPTLLQYAQPQRSRTPSSGVCLVFADQRVTGTSLTGTQSVMHHGVYGGAPMPTESDTACR